jgi:hypothetical protein
MGATKMTVLIIVASSVLAWLVSAPLGLGVAVAGLVGVWAAASARAFERRNYRQDWDPTLTREITHRRIGHHPAGRDIAR